MAPPLVDYGSDSEGSGPEQPRKPAAQPHKSPPSNLIAGSKRSQHSEGPAKRRKLTRFDSPDVSHSQSSKDAAEPSEQLVTKVVKAGQREGDWLCHAFVRVSVPIEIHDGLDAVVGTLRKAVSESDDLRITASETSDDTIFPQVEADLSLPSELHISLTRPLLVRPHERGAFRSIVTEHLCARKSFEFHFARVVTLINDDRSRLFFALEVGTGWAQLHELTLALNKPLEQAFRARAYYSEARYHSSFASIRLGQSADTQKWEELSQSLDKIIGQSLRRCPPFSAEHIGIRVGAHITDVSLQH
ncbi:poly(U)-specific 3'-to-5' RNA exonuclease [Tilletia horrida]|uniref:U6 snRNA phosphodiesterase 1 n=1 Tax=Tilletia horrida TaxID=155126 RepID=A0AAN6H0R1_9BASI|nr:poly(U)-specific 3'-to-5' RNA exonuclease [Tilletia horrida]KAK0557445.1 poly(U)-specific 3'-to-5' RNA exonuclease [Tilletia horrida]KAK0569549.1 poly(U)-specific 3'-to-5' RNA exonuclease [Tilletia horrida]